MSRSTRIMARSKKKKLIKRAVSEVKKALSKRNLKKQAGRAVKRNVKHAIKSKTPKPGYAKHLARPSAKFKLGTTIKIGNDFKKKRQLKKIKEWESKK